MKMTTAPPIKWMMIFIAGIMLIGCSLQNNDGNFSREQSELDEIVENNNDEDQLLVEILKEEKAKKEKIKEVELEKQKEEELEKKKQEEQEEKKRKEKKKKEQEELEKQAQAEEKEKEKGSENPRKKEENNPKKESEQPKKQEKKAEKKEEPNKEQKTKKKDKPKKESSKPKSQGNNSFANRVIELTNAEREKVGVKPLKKHNQLMKSAQAYSVDMYERGKMDHNGFGGFPGVLNSFSISYSTAAENVAQGQPSAEAVVNGWMNSPGHKNNMLHPDLTHIGVGYVSPGNYWTQHFIAE